MSGSRVLHRAGSSCMHTGCLHRCMKTGISGMVFASVLCTLFGKGKDVMMSAAFSDCWSDLLRADSQCQKVAAIHQSDCLLAKRLKHKTWCTRDSDVVLTARR